MNPVNDQGAYDIIINPSCYLVSEFIDGIDENKEDYFDQKSLKSDRMYFPEKQCLYA